MILDFIENAALYSGLHPGFAKAFAFLKDAKQKNLPAGRYEIDGASLYASASVYRTASPEQFKWEAHRRYIDIQFVKTGKETIEYAAFQQLEGLQPYDPEKDYIAADRAKEYSRLSLSSGMFAIFYPQDAHKPKCINGEETSVEKIIVKVLL